LQLLPLILGYYAQSLDHVSNTDYSAVFGKQLNGINLLEQRGQHRLRHFHGCDGSQVVQRVGSQLPHANIPVADLGFYKVVNYRIGVFAEPTDKHAELEVGVLPAAHGKVVSLGHYVDAVREGPLSSDILLEGG
jgi:hypothetical protein